MGASRRNAQPLNLKISAHNIGVTSNDNDYQFTFQDTGVYEVEVAIVGNAISESVTLPNGVTCVPVKAIRFYAQAGQSLTFPRSLSEVNYMSGITIKRLA